MTGSGMKDLSWSLLLLLLLLLIVVPPSQGQTYREVVEQAVRAPLKNIISVAEYNSPSDIYQGSYGFVNGVIYVDKSGFTFGAIPDLEMNIYASLILSEALQVSNFVTYDKREVDAAKARLGSMTSWLIDKARSSGLWGSDVSGQLVDISLSSQAIKAIAGAIATGALPPDRLGNLAISISRVIDLQSEGGGWGKIPEADIFQLKEPTPDITALALSALLSAREVGAKATGLDKSIEKAITYLKATAKRSKDMAYWQQEKISTIQVTSEVANALAEAMFQGFDVDEELMKGVVNYLEAQVKESYSSGTYDITTAIAIGALAKLSSLGFLETDKFITSWEPLIVDLSSSIQPDGLFSKLPFIWLRYAYTYPYVSVFSYWLRVSSISAQAYFIGGYGEYEPPVVVEGTDITLKIKVENRISSTLNLLMSLEVASPAQLVTAPPKELNLGGGKSKEISLKIKAPDKISSPKNITVRLFIREGGSGKPLFTKMLTFRILRNPQLSLESKIAKPTSVQLRKPINITLTLANLGDLPINDVSIIEKLMAGFELVTSFEGNGTALVTSTNSLGSYTFPSPLEPGAKLTLIYQVMPKDTPPGPQTVSTTLITYTDARGERHNLSKEVKVTVLRPFIVLSTNSSSLRMEWDEEKSLVIAISNTGNEDATDVELKISFGEGLTYNLTYVPKDVLLRPNPDGSTLIRVEKLKSGDTLSIPLRIKATNFYPATELGSFISIGYEYKDSIGRSMPQFSDSLIIKVAIVVSKTFIYVVSAIILIIAAFIAIRIYNRSKARKRESKRLSPLVSSPRKRGRRRTPFGG